MAPELARLDTGTELQPTAVDVYGIGVIAWELAHVGTDGTYQAPRIPASAFRSQFTITNLGGAVAAEPGRSCFWRGEDLEASVAPRVPDALGAPIRACLEVQPARRPSAEQAQTALQAALDALCSGEG